MSLNLNSSRIRIRDVSGGQDVFISGILSGLVAEMQSPAIANPLFVNGLLESLTLHLLRQYADTKSETKPRSTLLPAWKLCRVLEHMEAHLAEPFDLDALAALCRMSRFHFSRSFRATTAQTPSGMVHAAPRPEGIRNASQDQSFHYRDCLGNWIRKPKSFCSGLPQSNRSQSS